MSESRLNHWLRQIDEQWETPFDMSRHDHDHPFYVHPDWPPVNIFEQKLYQILHDGRSDKRKRLSGLYRKVGYSARDADKMAFDILKIFRG